MDQKSGCLLATMYKLAQANGMTNIDDSIIGRRCLTPREAEKLQTLDPDYTSVVSDTQRYKAIGNGWTVEVLTEIFKQIVSKT